MKAVPAAAAARLAPSSAAESGGESDRPKSKAIDKSAGGSKAVKSRNVSDLDSSGDFDNEMPSSASSRKQVGSSGVGTKKRSEVSSADEAGSGNNARGADMEREMREMQRMHDAEKKERQREHTVALRELDAAQRAELKQYRLKLNAQVCAMCCTILSPPIVV